MDNVIDFEAKKTIRSIKASIKELEDLEKTLKIILNSLTKFQKYSNIKKRTEELFKEFKDVQRAISNKRNILKTLEIRDVD